MRIKSGSTYREGYRDGVSQSVSEFFVNLSSVADRKDPDEPSFAIDFIDEAKSSHLVFPEVG
jgi:hypothetical protein